MKTATLNGLPVPVDTVPEVFTHAQKELYGRAFDILAKIGEQHTATIGPLGSSDRLLQIGASCEYGQGFSIEFTIKFKGDQ